MHGWYELVVIVLMSRRSEMAREVFEKTCNPLSEVRETGLTHKRMF